MEADPGRAVSHPPPPPPPPPPPSAPAGKGIRWWPAAIGLLAAAIVVAAVLAVKGGDGPATTLAGFTSTTTTGAESTTASTGPATTSATTTTIIAPATTTTSTTSTTLPGPAYDRAALDYFREIAGTAEFGEGGGVVHRWTEDLRIVVHGDPTPRDRRALDRVVADLNEIVDTIEFGVVEDDPNVEIHFLPVDDFAAVEPNYVPGNLGYVYIWWDADGSITRGRVLVSTTGLTPDERVHLIREELTQGLGLLNDSWLYPDSIFYQGWTDTNRYAPIDRLVIEMLYRPELAAGMGIDEALAVLSGLDAD